MTISSAIAISNSAERDDAGPSPPPSPTSDFSDSSSAYESLLSVGLEWPSIARRWTNADDDHSGAAAAEEEVYSPPSSYETSLYFGSPNLDRERDVAAEQLGPVASTSRGTDVKARSLAEDGDTREESVGKGKGKGKEVPSNEDSNVETPPPRVVSAPVTPTPPSAEAIPTATLNVTPDPVAPPPAFPTHPISPPRTPRRRLFSFRSTPPSREPTPPSTPRSRSSSSLSFLASRRSSIDNLKKPFLRRKTVTSGPYVSESSTSSILSIPARPRANSVPLLSSPLADALRPVERDLEAVTRDLFDALLPREIKLRILRELVHSFINEKKDGSRWTGEAKGRRELLRSGRVSKSWLSLSLDGQLWPVVSASLLGPEFLNHGFLLRLFGSAGKFVRVLDLKGMANLPDDLLSAMTVLSWGDGNSTMFEVVDLTSCHTLTTRTINNLIAQSPRLTTLTLSGLSTVDQTTFTLLASNPLTSLSISRCPSLPAAALLHVAPTLRVLRASRLRHVTDSLLVAFARRFTELEVLDLSYTDHLTDDAFRQLTQTDAAFAGPKILLRPNQIGPWASDDEWKRILPWTHLQLSGCKLLTDRALQHLAHAVPSLKVMELARIGAALHPAGLVKLLQTTPGITKLDVEDGTSLTDEVVRQLRGSAIEVLVLSSCHQVTDAALRFLIDSCPSLTTLEADGTLISESTARAFVALARSRRARDAVLSILDNRFIGRRIHTLPYVRPRRGVEDYWAAPFRYHHEHGEALQECDPTDVVVRSFSGSLMVDSAAAETELRGPVPLGSWRDQTAAGRRARRRALSDMGRRRGDDDDTRGSCALM